MKYNLIRTGGFGDGLATSRFSSNSRRLQQLDWIFRILLLPLLAGLLHGGVPFRDSNIPPAQGEVFLYGTMFGDRPELHGPVLEDLMTRCEFPTPSGLFTGSIQSLVVQSAINGDLTFLWRVIPEPQSEGSVNAVRLTGFDDSVERADWILDNLGSIPPRFLRNHGSGVLSFRFSDPPIGSASGESSRFFYLQTTSREYARGGEIQLECGGAGCLSTSWPTFAPALTPPKVTISRRGEDSIVLSWPTSFPQFYLQEATSLEADAYSSPVLAPREDHGDHFSTVVAIVFNERYFHLDRKAPPRITNPCVGNDPSQFPVTEADILGSPAASILHRRCAPDACPEDQPLCPPDPRLTCQLVDVLDLVEDPAHFKNAKKGDLFLCPATSDGMIGGLLGALDPPQHYTHMGIFIDNGRTIRHCTVSGQWLKDEQNMNGSIFGEPAPTSGFKEEALCHGWPGTISQSVEEILKTQSGQGTPILHAKDGKSYVIDALSFGSVLLNDERRRYDPLIVRPCWKDEARWPGLRPILHAVAETSKEIRGHYSFYAYSKADIAFDPNYAGPAMYEDQRRDPLNPCGTIPTTSTLPMMCSSFVWTSIKTLSQNLGRPILVDPIRYSTPTCSPWLFPDPAGDNPMGGEDGLFFYDVQQRQRAGRQLYDHIYQEVRATAKDKINAKLDSLGIKPALIIDAILSGSLPAAVAAATGLGGDLFADFLLLWTDMPDDVATQVCNTFASGTCKEEAKDDDAWENPGNGVSVSPDDILRWDAPQLLNIDGPIVGLYGSNFKATPRPSSRKLRKITAWEVSPGPGAIAGQVFYRGQPVEGATVRINCTEAITDKDGIYRMCVPAGRYLMKAEVWDEVNGWNVTGEQEVKIGYKEFYLAPRLDVQPLPREFRLVEVEYEATLVSRTIDDDEDEKVTPKGIVTPFFLGPLDDGNPAVGAQTEIRFGASLPTEGRAEVVIRVSRANGGAVQIDSVHAHYFDDDDEDADGKSSAPVVVNEDGSAKFVIDLKSGETWPDRAHIEFTLFNRRMP